MDSIDHLKKTKEYQRLFEAYTGPIQPWKKWGPYLSERSWGTVREDYSHDGDAWNFLSHDLARSKAYRWGEDGIAGFSDRFQILCFSLALWNGCDPILKERLFGLSHDEGNHGEDVKEYYYYLDGLPTHSYMKYLYKYPQSEFPYDQLVLENKSRSSTEEEFELIQTGVFNENRYFDVFIEYAKVDAEDLCIRIQAFNRGLKASRLDLIPQLWFRNTWSWGEEMRPKPSIVNVSTQGVIGLLADDTPTVSMSNLIFKYHLGKRYLYGPVGGEILFTDNETNNERVFSDPFNTRSPYVKDAFHRHIIHNEACVNLEEKGTKTGLHYTSIIPPGDSITLCFRLTPTPMDNPLQDVEEIIEKRITEADQYYESIHPPKASKEERMIQRQALAGMLWSKQSYFFDVNLWLDGDNPKYPPVRDRAFSRNKHWRHLNSMRIISMPDKWEYPWFAAWDLAFHAVTLALIDIDFAKDQVLLLLLEQFQHPNGQIPAYEWEYSDLNPPILSWAALEVYQIEQKKWGKKDIVFLKKCFHKLLINFTWWVNRKDRTGKNIFEGGFLGLDNITVIDRSEKIPEGLNLHQADATAWMAKFCLDLMRMAIELAQDDPSYEVLATKFFEHYASVGAAMKKIGGHDYEFWSESDGFFYDVLCGESLYQKLRVRSIVGIIPLFAFERLQRSSIDDLSDFQKDVDWYLANKKIMTQACMTHVNDVDGNENLVCALTSPEQTARILKKIADEKEFLSPYGIRSVSKYHKKHPFTYLGQTVEYEPGESADNMKGGNSNWRGPIWLPINYMLIRSLQTMEQAFGTSLNPPFSFHSMAEDLANRIISLFTVDTKGNRPIYGDEITFQKNPHWKDLILFFEYYNGDTGKGLGASHQTGWSGIVANLIDEWRR